MKPAATASHIYLRNQKPLSGEDLRQLEDFMAHLRNFYGIPADESVFPKRPRQEGRAKQPSTPSKNAINPADHPWRRT